MVTARGLSAEGVRGAILSTGRRPPGAADCAGSGPARADDPGRRAAPHCPGLTRRGRPCDGGPCGARTVPESRHVFDGGNQARP